MHSYPVDLRAGQFLRVVVQESGIDLTVRLFGADGTVLAGADGLVASPLVAGGTDEDLAALAETAGTHHLEIRSYKPDAPVARYRLEVKSLREERDQDKLRAEAVRAVWRASQQPEDHDGFARRLQDLEKALAIWKSLGEQRRSAEILFFQGLTRAALSDFERAAEDFRQAAGAWADVPGRQSSYWKVLALGQKARTLRNDLQQEEARNQYEEVLSLARETGNRVLIAESLSNLGLAETELGELRRGIGFLQEALEISRKDGYRDREVLALNNLAYAYERLGERQKALQAYQETLSLARALGRQETQALALNNLGDTYFSLGDWEKAASYFRQSLEINQALRNRGNEARTLVSLGATYRQLQRFEEAHQALDQALELSRATDDLETRANALTTKALTLVRQKRPAEGIETARQALLYSGDLWAAEADARNVLGIAYSETGRLSSARSELERAQALARQWGDAGREAYYLFHMARIDREAGDLPASLARVRSAIEILESLRARVVNPELRALFLASRQDVYEFQIDTLMALEAAQPGQGFAAAALEASEQARARSLLEILQESEADIRAGANPELVAREARLREEINTLEWRRLNLLSREKAEADTLAAAERRLESSQEEYRKVQDELRAGSPHYAALTQPRPLSESEIRQQLLDGRALLLEYTLGKERSFLWAVSPDSIRSFELPGREVIETLARRWYELLTVRNQRLPGESLPAWKKRIQEADLEAERVARELSQKILQPVEGELRERPLLVVADGALQYIPFAALPLPSTGAPLVTRQEVVSLPSASALAVLRRDLYGRAPAPRLLAILADPVFQQDDARLAKPSVAPSSPYLASSSPRGAWTAREGGETGTDLSSLRRLPYSLKEAQTIASFAPAGQVFVATGFEANRGAATSSELALYRNVHFATHGVLDSRRPELSGLVFSLFDKDGKRQDGFLRLNDIYNLRLDADLVALSACQTALGKEIRGEGLVGLTRGFMYAGAARVLASLWSVDDRPTADLMGSFYRGVLREKLPPASALRKAQLEMMQNPNRKSPYFWAGFTLQGEWR